jgi:hypothetical protein
MPAPAAARCGLAATRLEGDLAVWRHFVVPAQQPGSNASPGFDFAVTAVFHSVAVVSKHVTNNA